MIFAFCAAKKLCKYCLQPETPISKVLEKKLGCGKTLFRTVLARDAHVCGLGFDDPSSDATVGENSSKALDKLLPKIPAVSRKGASATSWLAVTAV